VETACFSLEGEIGEPEESETAELRDSVVRVLTLLALALLPEDSVS
jgi:hypothetical protein